MEEFFDFFDYLLIDTESFKLKVFDIIELLIIYLSARILYYLVVRVLTKQLKRQKINIGNKMAIRQIIKYSLIIIGSLLSLNVIGFDISLLLVGSAALMVGIGFGLQNTISDIFSGFIILFEGTISVHDIVEADGLVGRVTDIGLRTSKILTRDDTVVIIPNSRITNDKIINWSHQIAKQTRFSINFGVSYKSDITQVEKIILEQADKHPLINKKPSPEVRLERFGESSIDFMLLFWSYEAFAVERTKSDIRKSVFQRFREEGVEIPLPQRDLHIRSIEKNTPFTVKKVE